MAKFKCHCEFHIIDFDKKPLSKKNDYLGITIYQHKSFSTGKLFKKPKEQGTVVLIDKEAIKFKEWFNKKEGK